MAAGHLDPEWWLRCTEAHKGRLTPTDLCTYCGHARMIHTLTGGCTAHSTALVGAPHACTCTNKCNGVIFRDAATLKQLTSRG